MTFGFGKEQNMAANAAPPLVAPKILRSRSAVADGRKAHGFRFNPGTFVAATDDAGPAKYSLHVHGVSSRVSPAENLEPSGIVFEPPTAADSTAILAEIVEETIILGVSSAETRETRTISRLRGSTKCRYCRIFLRNRPEKAVPTVASTAEYVVKDAARCRELDINQGMVPPEKHGVVAASVFVRRRR